MVTCDRIRLLLLFLLLAIGGILIYYFMQYKVTVLEEENTQIKLRGLRLIQLEQFRRKNHISNVCSQPGYNKSLDSLELAPLDHFIIDDDHKIVYCYIPDVADTNWKRIFMTLKDGERKNPLEFRENETHSYEFKTLSSLSKEEMKNILENYTKFLFVRHPYERLLSAFSNKFENIYSTYFRDRYGRKIVKQYRQNATKESLDRANDITFMEFLTYVSDLDSKNNSVSFNEHWRPMFDLCFPCSIKYDVVGKYETLDADADYTLWLAGLSNMVSFPNREDNYSKQRSSHLLSSYYQNISTKVVSKLMNIYNDDFILFEYCDSPWS